jgi:predicted nucleic acid-binding protein
LVISAITEMELYVGALNKRELNYIKKRLEEIGIIDFNRGQSGLTGGIE